MGTDAQPTFRTPLILLAIADLAILGVRLWPWQDAMNLPGSGTAAIDPAVTLVAYIGLSFWISNTQSASGRKALFSSGLLGLLGGLLLAGQVALASRPVAEDGSPTSMIQMGLMAAAAVVCGIAGLGAIRTGQSLGFSAVCAAWCAMVSCLMACTFMLTEGYFSMAPPESPDPWQQYEGLAIGTPATQALVHSLITVTGFLLIGPIIGGLAGVLFAWFAPPRKA
jgi:hypothetical protein